MKRIGILNGPNLNLLGAREPEVYGPTTYAELLRSLEDRGAAAGVGVVAFQSNHEGALIDRVQEWARDSDMVGLVVNPGGLTHSSVSLRDALRVLPFPVVEVHLSNIAAREDFRRRSLISGVVRAVISGLGVDGYLAAVEHLARSAEGPARLSPPRA